MYYDAGNTDFIHYTDFESERSKLNEMQLDNGSKKNKNDGTTNVADEHEAEDKEKEAVAEVTVSSQGSKVIPEEEKLRIQKDGLGELSLIGGPAPLSEAQKKLLRFKPMKDEPKKQISKLKEEELRHHLERSEGHGGSDGHSHGETDSKIKEENFQLWNDVIEAVQEKLNSLNPDKDLQPLYTKVKSSYTNMTPPDMKSMTQKMNKWMQTSNKMEIKEIFQCMRFVKKILFRSLVEMKAELFEIDPGMSLLGEFKQDTMTWKEKVLDTGTVKERLEAMLIRGFENFSMKRRVEEWEGDSLLGRERSRKRKLKDS